MGKINTAAGLTLAELQARRAVEDDRRRAQREQNQANASALTGITNAVLSGIADVDARGFRQSQTASPYEALAIFEEMNAPVVPPAVIGNSKPQGTQSTEQAPPAIVKEEDIYPVADVELPKIPESAKGIFDDKGRQIAPNLSSYSHTSGRENGTETKPIDYSARENRAVVTKYQDRTKVDSTDAYQPLDALVNSGPPQETVHRYPEIYPIQKNLLRPVKLPFIFDDDEIAIPNRKALQEKPKEDTIPTYNYTQDNRGNSYQEELKRYKDAGLVPTPTREAYEAANKPLNAGQEEQIARIKERANQRAEASVVAAMASTDPLATGPKTLIQRIDERAQKLAKETGQPLAITRGHIAAAYLSQIDDSEKRRLRDAERQLRERRLSLNIKSADAKQARDAVGVLGDLAKDIAAPYAATASSGLLKSRSVREQESIIQEQAEIAADRMMPWFAQMADPADIPALRDTFVNLVAGHITDEIVNIRSKEASTANAVAKPYQDAIDNEIILNRDAYKRAKDQEDAKFKRAQEAFRITRTKSANKSDDGMTEVERLTKIIAANKAMLDPNGAHGAEAKRAAREQILQAVGELNALLKDPIKGKPFQEAAGSAGVSVGYTIPIIMEMMGDGLITPEDIAANEIVLNPRYFPPPFRGVSGTFSGGSLLPKQQGSVVVPKVDPPKVEPVVAPKVEPVVVPKVDPPKVEAPVKPVVVPKVDPPIAKEDDDKKKKPVVKPKVEPVVPPVVVPKVDPPIAKEDDDKKKKPATQSSVADDGFDFTDVKTPKEDDDKKKKPAAKPKVKPVVVPKVDPPIAKEDDDKKKKPATQSSVADDGFDFTDVKIPKEGDDKKKKPAAKPKVEPAAGIDFGEEDAVMSAAEKAESDRIAKEDADKKKKPVVKPKVEPAGIFFSDEEAAMSDADKAESDRIAKEDADKKKQKKPATQSSVADDGFDFNDVKIGTASAVPVFTSLEQINAYDETKLAKANSHPNNRKRSIELLRAMASMTSAKTLSERAKYERQIIDLTNAIVRNAQ